MQIDNSSGNVVYSAGDLTDFLDCPHLTRLRSIDLKTPLPKTEADSSMELIIRKAKEHESNYLDHLRTEGYSIACIPEETADLNLLYKATCKAMSSGVDYIYQATLFDGNFMGRADFLVKVPVSSGYGDYSYEVLDVKLAKAPRPQALIQLCHYSELLGAAQKKLPVKLHIYTGSSSLESYKTFNYIHYYRSIKNEFLEFIHRNDDVEPFPCSHCALCQFSELCEKRWEESDHLCRVADIRRGQVRKLQNAGIHTLTALAESKISVPYIDAAVLDRLKTQARLQRHKNNTGEDAFELRSSESLEKGLSLLPSPTPYDIFFDMEGDPLIQSRGLEYLFGFWYLEDSIPSFKAFWAHSYEEEKKAFEDAVDFMVTQKKAHPELHVYHYNHYEVTALKRLMSFHGTREDEVDFLLRSSCFVDLYRTVRNSIIVSEPGYSIKNLEAFYSDKRSGEVKNAVESIVQYERFIETRDESLLKEIEEYNRTDCESLQGLHKWLYGLKLETKLPDLSFTLNSVDELENLYKDSSTPLEKEIASWLDSSQDNLEIATREQLVLLLQILQFHKREKKPHYWNLFSKLEMTEEELLLDPECLASVSITSVSDSGRSFQYECTFPEQDCKIVEGQSFSIVETKEELGNILTLDMEKLKMIFRRSRNKEALPSQINLGPGRPLDTSVIEKALTNFVEDSFRSISRTGHPRYKAGLELLKKDIPDILSMRKGDPLVNYNEDLILQLCNIVDSMNSTYLFIQGPPGSGKTYTASQLILHLLRKRKKVAVTANSHKAINNLLSAVETRSKEGGYSSFTGCKKSSGSSQQLNGSFIRDVSDNNQIPHNVELLGATAWTLCRDNFSGYFDYLFIDEAGQTSLANSMALSTCTKNLVLLGDQMQLGSPIIANHPGESGSTILDYLLKNISVVPPEQGVFLNKTWRMNPDICSFISDAIYESQLLPVKKTAHQELLLPSKLEKLYRHTGINFIPVSHNGNSQKSREEAQLIKDLYLSLISSEFIDAEGRKKRISSENILVVAPYNMQVNLLRYVLPDGARVGTVDKFQGQEAEVVFVSMATSSQEELPRQMDFLFSRNRLNVSISRAKTKVFLLCCPELLKVRCTIPEQMELVDTLCFAAEYGNIRNLRQEISETRS